MARIAGVTIPDNKRIEIALTYIKGIGRSSSRKILTRIGISPDIRTGKLSPEDVGRLRDMIEREYKVEGVLRREIIQSIKRLKDIGSWRGLRHIKKLPARGQRTRTNSRTVRGNVRKTMGSGKRKLEKT